MGFEFESTRIRQRLTKALQCKEPVYLAASPKGGFYFLEECISAKKCKALLAVRGVLCFPQFLHIFQQY
jgi:hypothetical protein